MKAGRRTRIVGTALVAIGAAVIGLSYAPAVLAFPYEQRVGATQVHAERPIEPRLLEELARADALLADSPINVPGLPRDIYLTDGGWRWRLLAVRTPDAFAFRRPFRDAIIVNRSDMARDRVETQRAVANVRTLSGVIAHESTHILLARHFGEWRMLTMPSWKQEGYADYVARESSLPDADVARLRTACRSDQALYYYDARRRVVAELARNGGSVDRLFD